MNTVLWILQGVAALAFLMAGAAKATQPVAKLRERMGWVDDFGPNAVRAIGAAEILGAVGLILPGVTGIAPVLVPIAAICLGVTMVGAFIVHLRRKEGAVAIAPVVLLVLVAMVAWGRLGTYPL